MFKKFTRWLNKLFGTKAGVVNHVNEAIEATDALTVFKKEARKAMKDAGVWHQDFHNCEPIALVAVYKATNTEVKKKERALEKAIEFIGFFETKKEYRLIAIETLEEVNKILTGETIEESAKQQRRNKN